MHSGLSMRGSEVSDRTGPPKSWGLHREKIRLMPPSAERSLEKLKTDVSVLTRFTWCLCCRRGIRAATYRGPNNIYLQKKRRLEAHRNTEYRSLDSSDCSRTGSKLPSRSRDRRSEIDEAPNPRPMRSPSSRAGASAVTSDPIDC